MTPQDLQALMPYSGARAFDFAQPLTAAMLEFAINTDQRRAAFLAQVAHESGSLRYTLELASGAAYEGRKDLGNTDIGDGARFKGRGLLQVTGRANYLRCGGALGLDLLRMPELLERPAGAARSAAWYWHASDLNRFADRDQFFALTRAINGGYNGGDERLAAWLVARRVLKL
jgi:putative chitinase